MDHLDDRMDKSVCNFVHLKKDGSSSEEEGEEPSIPASTSPRGLLIVSNGDTWTLGWGCESKV